MKKNINYLFLSCALGLGLASCGEDYDDYVVGEAQSADNQGVYFTVKSQTLEFDPDADTKFELQVSRLNRSAALSLPLDITVNTDSVFEVPAAVEFAAGDSVATVEINFPKAELGNAYTLNVTIPSEYRSIYTTFDGSLSTSVTVARIKWESIGTAYWKDGLIASVFGAAGDPMLVSVEKAETPVSTKYRFASPYAYLCTGKDSLGIANIGYEYNEEGDCDNQEHLFVITITGKEASLDVVESGMNWSGYGAISFGSIYGNLSSKKDTYPLGYMAADGSKIVFPENSLFVYLSEYNGGYTGVASSPSILYFKPDELLVPDEYQPVGYGTYNFDAFFNWNLRYPDYCVLELCRSTEDSTKYRIDGWDLLGNVDALYFTCDTKGIISVEEQYTGYTDEDDEEEGYEGMGEIYLESFVETQSTFNKETMEYELDTVAISSYSPELNTFNFNLLYSASVAGKVSYGIETFVVEEWYTEEEENDPVEASMRRRAARMTSEKSIRRRPVVSHKNLIKNAL